ncbi:hypothetical protein [Thiolapillus sp.]|uniref:hypothetical protein n=1 Tax=Thiolapillus sp. TaxID=2017437 RepID=UPI00263BB246|nr:hypothetical protein [Thiolapillus sp.]
MTRTAGAPIGCQRPSRFWGLGCPKIYHEVEDTLGCFSAFEIHQDPDFPRSRIARFVDRDSAPQPPTCPRPRVKVGRMRFVPHRILPGRYRS